MADSSDVDAAICAVLANDAQIASVLTNGVYFDVAAPGSTKFAIVSLAIHEDTYEFTDEAYEKFTYLVKAVTSGTSGSDVKKAAARMRALLDGATIPISGYHTIKIQRVEYVRYTEVDEVSDARWQHRGGRYEVWVHPTTPPS